VASAEVFEFCGSIHAGREPHTTSGITTALVRPFDWGLQFISDHVNGDDRGRCCVSTPNRQWPEARISTALPEFLDFQLQGDQLPGPAPFHARRRLKTTWRAPVIFRSRLNGRKAASFSVVVLRRDAQPQSHVEACRIFNFIGMSGYV